MSESRALAVRDEMTLSDTMTLGETLAKSGYFQDAKQAAQAVVKILAGRELGVGPIASMTGINIIQGQVAIGANVLAATIKRDPRYDYRVLTLTDEACEIAFYEQGREAGRSEFTMQNAQDTKFYDAKSKDWKPLASKFNWRSFPRNMLFARAISNGAKWYCPDAAGGSPIYTPEELGASVDGETGEVITITREPEPVTEPPKSEPGPFNPEMPTVGAWHELHDAAVRQLHYSHTNHVKNTLKKVFNGQSDDLTFEAAWKALVEHQQSKDAPIDAEQAEDELFGEVPA